MDKRLITAPHDVKEIQVIEWVKKDGEQHCWDTLFGWLPMATGVFNKVLHPVIVLLILTFLPFILIIALYIKLWRIIERLSPKSWDRGKKGQMHSVSFLIFSLFKEWFTKSIVDVCATGWCRIPEDKGLMCMPQIPTAGWLQSWPRILDNDTPWKRTRCSFRRGAYRGRAALFQDNHPCSSSWT